MRRWIVAALLLLVACMSAHAADFSLGYSASLAPPHKEEHAQARLRNTAGSRLTLVNGAGS